MKALYRAHFLTVFFSLTKYFWVLLIPVVRAVLALGFDYQNAFRGYEADILLLTILLIYALSRWFTTFISVTEKEITFKRGVVFRKKVLAEPEKITCIKLWQTPFFVIFRCFILRVYQNPTKRPIIKMYCTRRTAQKIKKLYFEGEDELCRCGGNPFLHSLIFSSSKGGFLALSALLSFSGVVTGKTVRRLAQENIAIVSGFAGDIPTLLTALGVFFLTVRLISFLLEAFYVSDMKLYEQKEHLLIKRGFLKKSVYRINTKKENLGYSLSTNCIFFKRYYSLYVGITGFGQGKYDNSLIMPITDKVTVKKETAKLYSDEGYAKKRIFAGKKAIGSYITKWFVMYIVSCLLCSSFASLGLFGNTFYLALIPPFLFLFLIFVNMNKWRYGYVCIKGENVVIQNLKGVKICEYITERKKCRKVQIVQNVFQKRKEIADLCLYLRGERNKKVRIRNIEMEKCVEIAEMP